MGTNMNPNDTTKKRIFQLERGDLYGQRPNKVPVHDPVIQKLDRRVQDAAVMIVGADGTVPSAGIYKIREADQHPARILGRRCVEAKAKGSPREQVEAMWLAGVEWVRQDLYGDVPKSAA